MLRALAAESGETINLAVPAPTGVNHLAQVDSRHMIGAAQLGRARGARSTPARQRQGLPRVRRRRSCRRASSTRFTPHTITDREHLTAALDTIRAVGYATAIDEIEVGLSAVAAPVRGADRRVRRRPLDLRPELPPRRRRSSTTLGALLVEQAAVLSTRLGYPTLERG